MRFRMYNVICAVVLWLTTTATFAAVPSLVNYQGLLTNGGGAPQVGTFSVTFAIYPLQAGGVAAWTETQSVTTNSAGSFNVLLGSMTPLTDAEFSGTDRYLGISVSPDGEMSARIRIATAAYAFRPATIDGASGGNITSKVSIGPGHTNTGTNAFVAGENNTGSGDNSTVSGGIGNSASVAQATVSGGSVNAASGTQATVGGGVFDTASNDNATVGGGLSKTASGNSATIGGGANNTASGGATTVSGGSTNNATGDYATVGGGYVNTASGFYATTPGGLGNAASGRFSLAGGRGAQANHSGAFVWADSSVTAFSSTGPNQFLIRASGGVGIGTASPTSTLHVNGSLAVGVLTTSNNTVLDGSYSLVIVVGGAVPNITLPSASSCPGRMITIKAAVSGGGCTVLSSGGLIEGAASFGLGGGSRGTFASNGSEWYLVS